MHHLYPTTTKGDPLCPLGFHPQVRWPTRCKRCFRDYKEHGNRNKDSDSGTGSSIRRDELTVSSPSLSSWSSLSSRSRDDSRSSNTSDSLRSWTSSTISDSKTSSDPAPRSSDSSVAARFGNSTARPASSWTSTPDLGNLDSNVTTVSVTLPRKRTPAPEHHQPPEDDDNFRSTSFTVRRRTASPSFTVSSTSTSSTPSPSPSSASQTETITATLPKPPSSRTSNSSNQTSSNSTGPASTSTPPLPPSGAQKTRTSSAGTTTKTSSSSSTAGPPSRRVRTKPSTQSKTEPSTSADVQFILQVKQSKERARMARKSAGSRGSSSGSEEESTIFDDDETSIAGTETTETTLIDRNEHDLLEEVQMLKQEVDVLRARCERVEREKSDILLRRLAAMETTPSKTTASEVLKLQRKINDVQTETEDLRDENKSLTLRIKEMEEELSSRPPAGANQRIVDELRSKLLAAETLCEELMDENEDMKRELRDLEEEIEEMQDNFREDQADEYTSLKKELEQTAKNCRILSFKLRKAERKAESVESEKAELEKRVREMGGGQEGPERMDRIRRLEADLAISHENTARLQRELEEANSKLKASEDDSTKKKAPMLGSIPKVPSGEQKVSRETLTRGGSQDDPVQLQRDLQDAAEREADLREQLKFAEEEILRKQLKQKSGSSISRDVRTGTGNQRNQSTQTEPELESPMNTWDTFEDLTELRPSLEVAMDNFLSSLEPFTSSAVPAVRVLLDAVLVYINELPITSDEDDSQSSSPSPTPVERVQLPSELLSLMESHFGLVEERTADTGFAIMKSPTFLAAPAQIRSRDRPAQTDTLFSEGISRGTSPCLIESESDECRQSNTAGDDVNVANVVDNDGIITERPDANTTDTATINITKSPKSDGDVEVRDGQNSPKPEPNVNTSESLNSVTSRASSTTDLIEVVTISRGTSVTELTIIEEMLSDKSKEQVFVSCGTSSDDLMLKTSRATSITDLEYASQFQIDDYPINSIDESQPSHEPESSNQITGTETVVLPAGTKDRSVCIVAPLRNDLTTPEPQNESTQTDSVESDDHLPSLLRVIRSVVSSPSSLEEHLPEIETLLPTVESILTGDGMREDMESLGLSPEDGVAFSVTGDGGGESSFAEPVEPRLKSPPPDPLYSLASWRRMQVSIGSAFSGGLLMSNINPIKALLAPLGIVNCVVVTALHLETLGLLTHQANSDQAQILRKKVSRVEDDNESLVLQLKKMATKARTRRHSPTPNRLTPEPAVDKDEGISDEEDPAELRLLLELNEQEAAVLRRKVEEMESESDKLKKKVKELQDKLTAKTSRKGVVAAAAAAASGADSILLEKKVKTLEEEISDLKKKSIEKDKDMERLNGELTLAKKQLKGPVSKAKTSDLSVEQTVDLKRQLQVIENEASILRTRTQNLEAENEKLSAENKRLQLSRGSRAVRDSSAGGGADLAALHEKITSLEAELASAHEKVKKLEAEASKSGTKKLGSTKNDDIDKVKLQLTKANKENEKLSGALNRLKEDAAENLSVFYKSRTPKKITDTTTKLQMKRMVEDLESEIGEVIVALRLAEEGKGKLSPANQFDESLKKQLAEKEAELKELKDRVETEKKSAKEATKRIEEEKSRLEKEIKKKEEEILKFSKELDKTKDDMERAAREKKRLQEENARLISEKREAASAAEGDLAELNRRLEVARSELESVQKSDRDKSKLTKELNEKNKQIADLEKKLKDSEEKIKKTEALLSLKKDRVAKVEKELAAEQQKLAESEDKSAKELEGLRQCVQELEAGKAGNSKQVSDLKENVRTLKSQLETLEKTKQSLDEKIKKLEGDHKITKNDLDSKIKKLESELQEEKKRADKQKQALDASETEVTQLKAKLKTATATSVTAKADAAKAEIQGLQQTLATQKREYDDLTAKYELLEEEHVAMKQRLVVEKESVETQLRTTSQELSSVQNQLRTLQETYTSKQDAWIKEKLEMQEKMQDALGKAEMAANDTWPLERSKLMAICDEKTSEVEQLRKESSVLSDQLDGARRECDDLRGKLDDYEKVAEVQRRMASESSSKDKELRELSSKLQQEERQRKTEVAQLKMRYDSRVTIINDELNSLQTQVSRFKRERDTFRHMLEGAQKTIAELRSNPGANKRLSSASSAEETEETRSKIASLEQQVGCLEDELSEARLVASKLKTELISEKSSWEVKLSEMQSKVNELEEDRLLASGRTKMSVVKTRMELAWHKEREEQTRLLQEASTLARDLRQTLFEVERERDKERLEAKRRHDQMKKSMEEDQEENRKKIMELQCDLLELRDAHAKLRTTNEKLRREKDRWDRERDELRQMASAKRRQDNDEDRRVQALLDQVEELMRISPELFPGRPPIAPTPPVRRKGPKSREASPGLEKSDYSREASVAGDDQRSQIQSTLQRLTDVTSELRRYQRSVEDERDRRRNMSLRSFRANSTESDTAAEVPSEPRSKVVGRGGSALHRKGSLLRKTLSLEQTSNAQDQNIWKGEGEDGSYNSLQSLDDNDIRANISRRDNSMDSRLSGGSTQSEVLHSSEKKKKKGILGKLTKRLTKSRSMDERDSRDTSLESLHNKEGSDSSLYKSDTDDLRGSKKDLKERFTGMFKKGSSSRSNSLERNAKPPTPSDAKRHKDTDVSHSSSISRPLAPRPTSTTPSASRRN